MQAFQAHYTSCKRGRSGSAGQQFRSVTPGLGDDALGFIQGRVGIVLPAGLPPTPTDEERRAFPVTLRHELLPDGRPMLLRVAWSGRDWAGRWGNEFGHAMVFPVAPPLWPVDLARWEGWIGELSPDADTLDDPPDLDPLEVEALAPTEDVGFAALSVFLRSEPARRAALAAALRLLHSPERGDRPLLILDEDGSGLLWHAAIQKCLCPPLAWSTPAALNLGELRGRCAYATTLPGTPLGVELIDRPGRHLRFSTQPPPAGGAPGAWDLLAGWMAHEPEELEHAHVLALYLPDMNQDIWAATVTVHAWAIEASGYQALSLEEALGHLRVAWGGRAAGAIWAAELAAAAPIAAEAGHAAEALALVDLAMEAFHGADEVASEQDRLPLIDAAASALLRVQQGLRDSADAAVHAESLRVLSRHPSLEFAWLDRWLGGAAVEDRVEDALADGAFACLRLVLEGGRVDALAPGLPPFPPTLYSSTARCGAKGFATLVEAATLGRLPPETLAKVAVHLDLDHLGRAGQALEVLAPMLGDHAPPLLGALEQGGALELLNAWALAALDGPSASPDAPEAAAPAENVRVTTWRRVVSRLERHAPLGARLARSHLRKAVAKALPPGECEQFAAQVLLSRDGDDVGIVEAGTLLPLANDAMAFGLGPPPDPRLRERLAGLAASARIALVPDRGRLWRAYEALRSDRPLRVEDLSGLSGALGVLRDGEYRSFLEETAWSALVQRPRERVLLEHLLAALSPRHHLQTWWEVYADEVLARMPTAAGSSNLTWTVATWVALPAHTPGLEHLGVYRREALQRLCDACVALPDRDWASLVNNVDRERWNSDWEEYQAIVEEERRATRGGSRAVMDRMFRRRSP